ncbi:MAG: hypothetical protein J2P46_18385 [Zavarzinella sp.]|nr:hypothetical protein [Zavarzinella sp.]
MHTVQLVSLALALVAPGPKDRAPKESGPPNLVGVWVCESLTYGGRLCPVPDLVWEFTAEGRVKLGRMGTARGEDGAYKVTAGKGPAGFDWDTEDVGAQYWGICKVEGDLLTLAYAVGGVNDRATKFESPAGSKVQLMTFRRVKPDE